MTLEEWALDYYNNIEEDMSIEEIKDDFAEQFYQVYSNMNNWVCEPRDEEYYTITEKGRRYLEYLEAQAVLREKYSDIENLFEE